MIILLDHMGYLDGYHCHCTYCHNNFRVELNYEMYECPHCGHEGEFFRLVDLEELVEKLGLKEDNCR